LAGGLLDDASYLGVGRGGREEQEAEADGERSEHASEPWV